MKHRIVGMWRHGSLRAMAVLAALVTLAATNLRAPLLHSSTLVARADTTYTITDLGTLYGSSNSLATAINDSGQVVGYGDCCNFYDHPFLWTPGGGMTNLGAFLTGVLAVVGAHLTEPTRGTAATTFVWTLRGPTGQALPLALVDLSGCWSRTDVRRLVARATQSMRSSKGWI